MWVGPISIGRRAHRGEGSGGRRREDAIAGGEGKWGRQRDRDVRRRSERTKA